jgi:hypothetical protein
MNYIENYPDLKEAGINSCEKAWNHYQAFGKRENRQFKIKIMNSPSSKYSIFYKNCSDFVLDFSQTIDYTINGQLVKLYSSTPCIMEYLGGYILNVRYVNYIIKEYDPVCTYSMNKHILLDTNFVKKEEYFHEYKFNLNSTVKHNGFEDIKLFNHNGKIYFNGCIFKNKKSYVIMDKVTFPFKFKENIVETNFNKNISWEKNWCFVKYKEDVCIIYDWFPIKLCKINGNTISIIKEIKCPSLFENVRGSTNGYTFKDEIWFIAHVNKKGDYYHLFVVFDLELNLKRYSNYFKFENQIVEFCLGLIVEEDRIIISYSTNDNTSKLMFIKRDSLKLDFNF